MADAALGRVRTNGDKVGRHMAAGHLATARHFSAKGTDINNMGRDYTLTGWTAAELAFGWP